MDKVKHICEKCGANHPTETHDDIVMMNLTNPDYLPSRQELLDLLKPQVKDDSREERSRKYDKIREIGHEILNKEFIEELANYLVLKINEYQKNNEPVIILEVGAGNGRLARFIREKLKNLASVKFEYISTDIRKGIYEQNPAFPIERIDYKDALKKYSPTIVICSWMPYKVDWTENFRKTQSVREYILIGEQASTGDAWLTWGNPYNVISVDDEEIEQLKKKRPPYEQDGFKSEYLEDVSKQQIESPGVKTHPATFSFRRTSK